VSDVNDWFKFIITLPGAITLPLGTGSESVALLPDHGSIATDLFVSQDNFCLEPDTYFLRFSTSNFGPCFNYQVPVRFTTANNFPQELEPNNDFAHAQPFDQDMYARVGYNSYDQNGTGTSDTFDYFQLITSEDGDLVIDIEPDPIRLPTYAVSLYSGVTNNPLQISTMGNPTLGDTVQIRLNCAQADTFYLRIQSTLFCGLYHIHYEVESDNVGLGTNEVEPNNSLAEAQDISNDPVIISSIDHRDNSNAPSYVYDEIDYYRLTPGIEGDLRVAISTEPGQFLFPTIILMDSLGNQLAFESSDTLIYECVSRLPYYLSVQANQCNQYRLEWHVLSDFDSDEEPNDMMAQASEFPLGSSVTAIEGRLGALQASNMNDTYDYYKVMMAIEGNTKLWFTGEEGLGTLDVWTDAGDLHSSYQALANDSVEIDLGCLALDTFYISVSTTSCIGYRISGRVDNFLLGNPDPEPNDLPGLATQIFGSDQFQGRLGGELISAGSLGDTKDYFQLIVPGNGSLTIDVNAQSATATSLISQVLASDGMTVFASDTLWNEGEAQYVYECMQPDTLYLLIKPLLIGLECQTYTVNVQFNGYLGTEDVEPNDNVDTAIPLVDGQTASGIVGLFRFGIADIDAADYYVFDALPGELLLSFNDFELLDSVRVTAWSDSEPELLQFFGQDIPAGGLYANSFNVNSSDPVYVEVQDIHECGFYELTLTQLVTGLEQVQAAPIMVFPNPVDRWVKVSGIQVRQLRLLDVQGRILKRADADEMVLDDIESGTYMLQILATGSQEMQYRMLVKQ
jgi:hypothetical protein